MKKLLLSGLLLSAFISANAQCGELFFSEYVEGSNNNKGVELYNPTANPITINGNYRIVRYNNGEGAAVQEALSQAMVVLGLHTIQPYDTWVLLIDKRNPAGTGTETPVSPAFQAVADTFICPDYATSYAVHHNGNDALSLQKNVNGTWTYVDIIGEIGFNPGASWSDCPPFYNDACGAYYTQNQTLVRKPTVQGGYTVNPSPFIAPEQWDSLPNNTSSMLGFHNCNCDPNYVGLKNEVKLSEVKIFPNPSNGKFLTIVSADKKIAKIEVMNQLGQLVKTIEVKNKLTSQKIELNIATGVYMLNVIFEDESTTSEKLIIE